MEYHNKVVIMGEGKPIVLIHGMGGPKFWDGIYERLAKYYKVIIPTLPGYEIEHGRIKYTDELYVEYLESLRVYLKIDKWSLIGLSMGGRAVINYCVKYEGNVEKMILIDSAGIGHMGSIFKVPVLRNFMAKWFYKKILDDRFENYLVEREFVEEKSKACISGKEWFHEIIINENTRYNFCNILSKIAVPIKGWKKKLRKIKISTLIMWGAEDGTTPLKWGYELNKIITNSKIMVMEKYKHMAILERPDFFIKEIIGFIN